MSRGRDQDGFTLVELLVAMTLMILVLGSVLTMFSQFQTTNRLNVAQNEAQDQARLFVDRVARELRSTISAGAPTPTPVERATGTDLVLQTVEQVAAPSGANVANHKRVRYCLDATAPERGRMWMQTQTWISATPQADPSGANAAPPCPDPAWNNQRLLADSVYNRGGGLTRPVFTYNPASWTSLSEIVAVRTDLFVDTTPGGRKPAESRLTSAVSLRNQNRRPTATVFVSVRNRHVIGNASASQDPENQPLTYQWFLDGGTTPIGTGPTLDYPPTLALGTTHTVTVKVTDSGGLTDSATGSITIS